MFDKLFGRKQSVALSLEIETLNNKRERLNRIEERMNLGLADVQDHRDYATLCDELGIKPECTLYEVDNPYFARA